MLLEVCCADKPSVHAAVYGGADRVELCSHLEVDGLTPDPELVAFALRQGIRVHVLVRPREGNFVYSEAEVVAMEQAILRFRQMGVHGVVIGALDAEGHIDIATCQRLLRQAEGMQVTFHRAFDVCSQPMACFSCILELGFHRLLTSGHQPTAIEGVELICKLIRHAAEAGSPLIVMPGSGLSPDNVMELMQRTQATECHGTLSFAYDGAKHTSLVKVRQVKEQLMLCQFQRYVSSCQGHE